MPEAYPEEQRFVDKMRSEELPARLIEVFGSQYRKYRAGDSGKLPWSELSPPGDDDIVDLATAHAPQFVQQGQQLLDHLACIKLNGGLGTTMKLARAKSLIAVREGQSFLRLVAKQVQLLRERHQAQTPLLLMNSFATRDDSLAELSGFSQPADLPLDFLQHKVPRIAADTFSPLEVSTDAQEWAPPGHGDVYLALYLCGLLERLQQAGYTWAMVSNVDNLGATVDPGILGYLDQTGADFAMEVTDKTLADIKGGTLVRYRERLMLLERVQVETAHLADFEEIGVFSVFNTNTLWWRIEAMLTRLEQGELDLPLIVNPKRVAGKRAIQLETAMGAGIGCFERAVGIRVPRTRFAPVKGTVDLLGVRSDAYIVDERGGLRPNPARSAQLGPPVIQLDPQYYQGIEEFEARFPHPLGLLHCASLQVEGDVRFGKGVQLEGDVVLRNTGSVQATIGDNAKLQSGTHEL